MTDIFGIASGWWSIAGLLADIVGVGLLSIDLIPEYRLHKARREITEGRRAHEAYVALNLSAEPKVNPAPNESEFIVHAREEHQKFVRATELMKVKAAALLAAGHLRIDTSRHSEPGQPMSLENALLLLSEAEQTERRRRDTPRSKRPPISFAIGLILFGFVLQIMGAIP